MAVYNYKGYLKAEVIKLKKKLETETNLGAKFRLKNEIQILQNRIKSDIRMGCYGSEV